MSVCDSHLHPHSGARPKRPYKSRGLAERAVSGIKKYGAPRARRPERVYLCEGCKHWFLTSNA